MGNGSCYHRPTKAIKPQAFLTTLLGTLLLNSCAQAATNTSSCAASLAAKETYDGNVWLQDSGPRRHRASMVTSLLPQAGVTWKHGDVLDALASYAGAASLFHSEPSENHMSHRGNLNWTAGGEHVAIDSANSIVLINGDDEGPTWTEPGGAPATGGAAVRDRRRALVLRNSLRFTATVEHWFVRPVATHYDHDWGTDLRNTPGYQNYVDRSEWTVGTDLGWKSDSGLSVFLGYRFGEQHQDKLLDFPEHYDSTFHRVLFGTEGNLLPWLKAAVCLGPEFRTYEESVARGFDDHSRVNFFVDAALTATPSSKDRLTISARQFQQPGFSGRSAYNDLTYDLEWRHAIGANWAVTTGTRAYNTYFLRPTRRDDWIVSPNMAISYAASPKLGLELSASHEIGLTTTRDAEGREYERTLVSVGVKYAFR